MIHYPWVMKMERVLLVEPNYKNKFPPIGLMKISTYYKGKGDFVEFHKGLLPQNEAKTFDKVFITTLFTFDFNICIQTIRYYVAIVGIDNLYVGGIAATIMSECFLKEIPDLNILRGQLVSSKALNYDDNKNIDILELDYDILWDVSYDYPMSDSYFIYTSRGCLRKCSFCAVKTLEPQFYNCVNIEEQIRNVDIHFGTKKQLLIMDNNILYSKKFDDTINKIKLLGFENNNNRIKKNNNMKYFIFSLKERIKLGKKYIDLFNRIKKEFVNLKFQRISKKDSPILENVIKKINSGNDSEIVNYILDNSEFIIEFFERYHYHIISRFVDFNQGLDARLLSAAKAKKLSELAVNPCRIAFDDLDTRKDYFDAMKYCVQNGITHFSNYLLYNFKEEPKDLWIRLYLNVQFAKQNNITLFSFPMKYAAIDQTDRSFIGKHWNRKYLRALNVILNVTSGVVAKEEDFFFRAYGHNETKFIEILTMPDEFIRHRDFFDAKGLIQLWRYNYLKLSSQEEKELMVILEKMVDNPEIVHRRHCRDVENILPYYSISKKNVIDNPLYYSNLVSTAIEENEMDLNAG
jgi:hypothetical protein